MKQFNDCALKSGKLTHMDKEQVVSILREHEPELNVY